jgi:hypothetical protein
MALNICRGLYWFVTIVYGVCLVGFIEWNQIEITV